MTHITKDEALKLALQALNEHEGNYKLGKEGVDRHVKAIAAIEQALAAPVQEPHPLDVLHIRRNAVERTLKCLNSSEQADLRLVLRDLSAALTAPPAQPAPVQEPVAWMHEWEDGERIPLLHKRDDRNTDQPKSVRPLVYGDTTAPAAPVPAIPMHRIADVESAEIDDMRPGRAYKEGWNECRASMLASAQPAVPLTDGKKYRLLEHGEEIESNDTVLDEDAVTWHPLAGWEVGLQWGGHFLMPMRREKAAHGITEKGGAA